MFLKIWDIFVNICEPFICFLIFRKKLGVKEKCLIPAILFIFLAAGETTYINYIEMNYSSVMIIAMAMYVIYALLFFKGGIWSSILWSAAFMFVIFISNTVVSTVFLQFLSASVLKYPTWSRFFMTSVYLVCLFLFSPLVMKFNEHDRFMSLFVKISIPVLCLIGGVTQYLLTEHIMLLSEMNMSVTICCIVEYISVALILFVLVMFDRMTKTAKEKYDAQIALTKANAEAEYNSQVSAVIDSFREIKHDYASHMTALSAYAKDGNIDAIRLYLSELDTQYGIEKYFIDTGNRTFDSVVTSKAIICSRLNIDFETSVLLPPVLPFSDVETAGLFGNLLDNAINAQSKVTAQKYIFLEVKTKGKMLSVTVKNSSCGEYRMKDGELFSTNEDTDSHGIGLKRIKAICAVHGGDLMLFPEKDCFTAQILVPLEMQEGGLC